jgi:cyclophilin family peptidyl-prolyl cis-trans isomerase
MTTQAAPFLDGKHVVFGKLLGQDSMLVLRKIENIATGIIIPALSISEIDAGVLIIILPQSRSQ